MLIQSCITNFQSYRKKQKVVWSPWYIFLLFFWRIGLHKNMVWYNYVSSNLLAKKWEKCIQIFTLSFFVDFENWQCNFGLAQGGGTSLIIRRAAPWGSVRRPSRFLDESVRRRTDKSARSPHGRRTDKIGRTDVHAAPYGRCTDTVPLPHGQSVDLITITTRRTDNLLI